jgi:MFS family permease
VLHFGPTEAGLSLLPLTLPLLVTAPLAGSIYDRIGPRLLVPTGAALIGAAMLWDAATLYHGSYAWVWPGYVGLGMGIGLVMTPALTDSMNAAEARLRGQVSGVLQTVRQVGGTLGVAIMGAIVANAQLDGPSTGVARAYALCGVLLAVGAVLAAVLLRRPAALQAKVAPVGDAQLLHRPVEV